MKKVLYLLVFGLFYSLSIFSQETSLIVDCQTPGWLSSKINYADQQTVKNLKVTGYINSEDLKFIGTLINSYSLNGRVDLNDVEIVNNDMGINSFGMPKNTSDIKSLKCLLLPQSLKSAYAILSIENKGSRPSAVLHTDTLCINWQNKSVVGYDIGGDITNLILGENIDSITDGLNGGVGKYFHGWQCARTFEGVSNLQSVQFAKGMHYIGRRAFGNLQSSNFNELEHLEYLGANAFTSVEFQKGLVGLCPDTIKVPKSLHNPFYLFAFAHKDGQHIFIDDNITTVSGFSDLWGDSGSSNTSAKLIFHINNMNPPKIVDYKFSNSTYNLSTSIVYVPKGAKQAYLNSDWNNATIIEANPNYSLQLIVSSNGSVYYSGTTIKNQTKSFNVEGGTSTTVTIIPDTGYRIKSVKLNGTDVTSSVLNNQYTINGIDGDVVLEVEFQIISKFITFADANVKSICVSKWDTDGDGELSEEEATAVTDIGSSFSGNTKITSFEELRYFTGIKEIPYRAFSDCTNLTTILMPNSVTSIRTQAFYGCSGLTGSLIIPNSVTSIENGAFYGCSGFTGPLIIPSSVTSIGEQAFGLCSGFTGSLTISNSVLSIGDGAFVNCNGFTGSLTIPNSVTTIGVGAFMDCNGFTGSLTIPNSVTSIGDYAFYGCSGLTGSLTIPNSVTTIGDWAFQHCRALTGSLSIPNSVTSIGQEVFSGCSGFTGTLNIPSSVTSIGNGAFENCSGFSFVQSEIETPFSIEYHVFHGFNSNAILQVPKGTKSKYMNYANWNRHFSKVIEEGPYTLSIKSTGNGTVTYNDTSIRENTSSFSVDYNSSATFTFTPDAGYRIKSVKLNTTDITSSIENSQYTISGIDDDMALEVEYEAIPPTVYSLDITAVGNGALTYNSSVIRGKTSSFNVNEGTKVSIALSPDNGYRIKSVKENGTDVIAYVSNQTYVINTLSRNTTVEVEFEAIPIVTYSLNIKSTGNGSVAYNGTSVRDNTTAFTVNEGTSLQIKFMPDEGYRVASVKLNNADVTSSITNNSYTINNVSANTSLEVVFEAIPPTTYLLDITAAGNGAVTYNSSVIRGKTSSFSVNEGTKVSIALSPDNGYRIKSVKENSTDVTAYVSNQAYVINALSRNTTIEVEFEAIPIVTYSISIKSTGNGSVAYNGTLVRDNTTTFTVNEGTSPQVTLNPDEGYRVASVKLNNVDVTANVFNNRYTIANISADANFEVTFESIPLTTYSLTITASGNGSVTYGSANLKNQTQAFTVNEGDNASLTISPESGFRIASVKVNNVDVTAQVANNLYTISKIITNTTVSVTFEAIPVVVYQLSITANGNGSATYDGMAFRGETKTFAVNEGMDVTISFSPDNGNSISSVKVNGNDVTADVVGNHYTINGMSGSMAVEVTFMEDVNALTVDGVNYIVISQTDKTIRVTGGNYNQVLTVPATINQNEQTWTVLGIEDDALKSNTELSAIIWNAEAAFTASVSNPNLLLYVKAEEYAPNNIRNVVVNGTASNITLVEALNGNDFYCPKAFVAQHISFTHHYGMTTGVQEARGWETIALPFGVQTITHASKGAIVPYEAWNGSSSAKPFWLYEMTGSGFAKASEIKAYTPYIISMPNNSQYTDEWLLNGNVTFEASGVYVDVTDNLHTAQQGDRTFVPCFSNRSSYEGLYALNVNNDYSQNQTGVLEGSRFVLNMRQVHPFEAYMTTGNNARAYLPIFEENMPTDISDALRLMNNEEITNRKVYNLNGQRVEHPKKGLYIINGKKVVVK